MQQAVNERPSVLEKGRLKDIEWLSPLKSDGYAEYRDGSFLSLLGLSSLSGKLKDFWPSRGPQWDALGIFQGNPILVEAKAHIGEFLTPPSGASAASQQQIARAFVETREALRASGGADWAKLFYQYANRLAHLHFLHREGVPATLLLVNFLGDTEMKGPENEAEWLAVKRAADYTLGLSPRHPLSAFVVQVCPRVQDLQ